MTRSLLRSLRFGQALAWSHYKQVLPAGNEFVYFYAGNRTAQRYVVRLGAAL